MIRAASVLVLFTLLILFCAASTRAQTDQPDVPIPSRIFPVGQAPTPAEYSLLESAINANWQREKARQLEIGPGLGSDFTHIYAVRIRLGALGEGMVVHFPTSPECGATGNCPMAVYVREVDGYRRVIDTGGWGVALLPSTSAVPDLAFYSHVSADETDSAVFHYASGQFSARNGPACTNQHDSQPVCAAIATALGPAHSTSPAEYAVLRPQVEADLERQSPALVAHLPFDQAHAIDIQFVNQMIITAIGWGSCGVNEDCRILIYAHNYGEKSYWLWLNNVSGWGVWREWKNGGRVFVARKISAIQDELTTYIAPPNGQLRDWGPGSHLVPKFCQLITPKTDYWPAEWNPAVFVAQPVPCSEAP